MCKNKILDIKPINFDCENMYLEPFDLELLKPYENSYRLPNVYGLRFVTMRIISIGCINDIELIYTCISSYGKLHFFGIDDIRHISYSLEEHRNMIEKLLYSNSEKEYFRALGYR